MSEHSIISASGAGRWVSCTGSVEMCRPIPEVISQSAAEGHAAHWAATEMIYGKDNMVGRKAPNGHIIDDEMVQHITPYVEDIHSVSRTHLMVEKTVPITRVNEAAFGTPDCWYFDIPNATLYIWDLKYGWGLVEVYENWQLIMYAIGVTDYIGEEHIDKIVMLLAQPRPPHKDGRIREWVIKATDLRPYGNILAAKAIEALSDNSTLSTGPWCRNCEALLVCPANRSATLNAIDITGLPVTPEKSDIGYELELLTRAKDLIKQRHEACETRAIELIKQGSQVSGWSIEPIPGRLQWTKTTAEVSILGSVYGIDLIQEPAAITPSQAITKGIPEPVITGYSERKPSSIKLTKDDFRRVFK